ncbi:Uncharacterized protein ALO83_03115 [Pseudomonas cannabina pv. alisalensis]|uniref:DUF4062 domain-containing protein n=2 Tax=Pseudomonas cannabina TaxID=86840 RepID=A0A3M3Q8X9_PSECA|nr:DUF4062 domain-containing protein [Pseudomonas cannabina]KPW17114.1 Uncharacterized protein ALO83_03115 [Pseudomonas cannabina pv. alisalensis]MBM0141913.1 DUF4062 domain-containing protein [Pseudomonas cannabina pv. alisalensis]RMN78452.1 hypothetical protein ALQ52_02671 [Pseudomonas cannabina pv. alisalensis]RMN80273.1 hypothetical protein ALQ53_00637 [Pseudomonas cannabina]RMO01152.1 hypothetical protein ALQ51_02144 [Pseudomonas cannabina]
MKVFISSVIKGFKDFRDAAKDAVETLDMRPIMSEHFGARAYSSEHACLTEVDQCDVYILILGANYGYESEPGLSVTQQEFRQAVSKRKPILVFVQQTDFDEKQAVFVNEVSDYKQGYFRASFSEPQELLRAIIQGLSRMEKSKSSFSERAFHERITEASSSRSYGTHSYAPRFEFAFLPQPTEQHAVHVASQRRDDAFQNFHKLGLAKLKQGYEDWDDKAFTGLKSGDTTWQVFDDGLVLIEADASVPVEGRSVGLYFVSPSHLSKLLLSCFEVAAFGSGWYRITLKNLDMAKVEEPPVTAPTSYSMPMQREKTVSESHLFIPATRAMSEQWVQEAIARMARSLTY